MQNQVNANGWNGNKMMVLKGVGWDVTVVEAAAGLPF